MTNIYQSSKGQKAIDTLPYPYLCNALAKLQREEPSRVPEIVAMTARKAELEALEALPDSSPAPAAIAAPGHNRPPTDSPFEAIKTHIDDLYAEAKAYLDGEPIATQGQADDVSKLLGMIKEAERAADDARKLENEPFDAGKAEVQARYAPLISDTKAVRGKTITAREACQKALTPWLKKLDAEREAAAQAARDEAERLAAEARAKAQSATSIDEAEQAEAMFTDSKAATREAASLEGDRARVGVGSGYRATILRDNWTPVLTDGTAALRHYWTARRADLEELALSWARADVRAGARAIPGFEIVNERKAV